MNEPFLSVSMDVASRDLAVALSLDEGDRLAVLGPNGAGKSTMLGVIAGVLRPDRGRGELAGSRLFDLDGRHPTWVPPHARGVALLAQDPLLFPHLTVLDNVAFGPRAGGERLAAARRRAHDWLDVVGATDLASRRPAQLSGGQAQRVAIARALAAEPRLLLLDEPMAALDVGAAPLLRRVLRDVLVERTAIIVTHDLLDAVLLSTKVIVIDGGRIVEAGETERVIQQPRTRFTARIAGLNLVTGVALGPTRVLGHDGVEIEGSPDENLTAGTPAVAVFGPTAVAVHADEPHGSPRNTFRVTVAELEPRDGRVRVRGVDGVGHVLLADITASSVRDLDLHPGGHAYFAAKATAVTIYAAARAAYTRAS